MKENKRNRSESNEQNEQLRNTNSNESIREVGQERSGQDNLRESDKGSGRSYDYGTPGSREAGSERSNISTGRNQSSSRENMAGTSDMSHDQEIGKGRDVRRSQGSGQNLAPKLGTTGSDFDGQNSI